MRKKILLFSALGTLVLGMTVCTGMGVSSLKKTETFSSTRAVTPPTDVEEYDAWLNSWSKPGHLYVHYNRGDKNDYNDFCFWMWNDEDDTNGTLWAYHGPTSYEGKSVEYHAMTDHWMYEGEIQSGEGNVMYKDQYGVIADINLEAEDLHIGKIKKGETVAPATYEGCEDFGFLFPRVDSMDGSAHWTSDGGKDNDVWDWREEKNWRDVTGGKALHIFFSSGQLDEYSYFAGSGIPQVKVNPIDIAEDNRYDSKVETIADTYGVSKTSSSFKKLGVGYQIFVASFRDSNGDGYGDLRGVIDSLDYLEDLGVEVLWLTPIQQSGSYHGYDIIDYYAVDKRFGTIEDYRELLFKAHQKGMKVLMDLVINHTSKNNTWFKKSEWGYNSFDGAPTDDTGIRWRDVYTWKYGTDVIPTAVKANGPLYDNDGHEIIDPSTGLQAVGEYVVKPISYTTQTVAQNAASHNGASWFKNGESNYYYYGKFGSDMPELNYENKQTRQLVQDMAKYWLSFGLDGFRLDAVKHIYMKDEVKDTGSDQIMPDVGVTMAYDEQNEEYIFKPYDYSQDLTKNIAFWKQFANEIKAVYPDCFLVGENFDGYGTRMAGYYQALDSQFDFAGYYHSADIYSNNAVSKYTQKRSTEVLNTFSNASNQIDDPYFVKEYESQPVPQITIPGGKRSDFINGAYTSNHDVLRAINKISESTHVTYSGSDGDTYRGRAKVAGAIALLAPGVSWIYYGDELGMASNTYNHVLTYGNENCIDTWYRQPFIWQGEKGNSVRPSYVNGKYQFKSESYDEYNAALFSNTKGVVVDANNDFTVNNEIYDFYKQVIQLKKMYPHAAKVSYGDGGHVIVMDIWSDEAPGDAYKIYINTGISDGEYLLNPGSDFANTPVMQINCSGMGKGSNFNAKYAVVAFKHN